MPILWGIIFYSYINPCVSSGNHTILSSSNRLWCGQGGKVKIGVIQAHAQRERGQSLTEMALFVPILLLMMIGFIEIGVYINAYITTVDATRGAARYVSAQDPIETGCFVFGSYNTGQWVYLTPKTCTQTEYKIGAQAVRGWTTSTLYATCQGYTQTNFYYLAGCMAVLNLPMGWLDPTPRHVWGPGEDYPGDDLIVTTIPITAGAPTGNARMWTLFDRQPTAAFQSEIISITNPAANEFQYKPSFLNSLSTYASAPSTGVVVVEAWHAHPQITKLFTVVNLLAGSRAWLPDPIPIHAYSVFPVASIDPARTQ